MDKLIKQMHKDLNAEVGWNLYKTGMMLRRDGMRKFAMFGITPEQWQVMLILYKKGALTQKAIRDITIQDAPTISRVVQRLLKKKFVKKTSSTKDKRAVLIDMAPAGLKLLNTILKQIKKNHGKATGKFNDVKKRQLIKLLKELREEMEVVHSNGGKK